eukprot:8497204-Alexandrium_andersonii.AAC.1
MDSRLERIAQVAEVAGQQRIGLAGELPWVSLEPRRPPRPGRASALPPEAELRPPSVPTAGGGRALKGESEKAVWEGRRRTLGNEWGHARQDLAACRFSGHEVTGGQRRTAWSRGEVAFGSDHGPEASCCAVERLHSPGKNDKLCFCDDWL